MEIKNKISADDLLEIYEISKQQFGAESWTFEQFENSYSSPTTIFLVMKTETIKSFLVAQDCVDSFDLLLVATSESDKRKGLASALLSELETFKKPIFLEVKESNVPAQKLYESKDYKLISRRKNYYKNGEDALIFQKK